LFTLFSVDVKPGRLQACFAFGSLYFLFPHLLTSVTVGMVAQVSRFRVTLAYTFSWQVAYLLQ